MHECSECGEPFKGVVNRDIHEKVEHGDAEVDGDGDYTTAVCEWCGNEYYLSASNQDSRRHCSRDCMERHKHGLTKGDRDYWKGWNQRRNAVRQRDDHRCVICGVEENGDIGALDVHHIIRARAYEAPQRRDSLLNLVSVCRGCHGTLESMETRDAIQFLREVFYAQAERRVQYLLAELARLDDREDPQ